MNSRLKIGSLFSGTGALDLAVEQVTGATPAWFVEYDQAPAKILAHHWPTVPNYGDVTKIRWEDMPSVDIITGGTPCQDMSSAGKRAGMTEGTRSNLWVNMREAINIIRPRLVVWENVLGALSAKATSDSDMEPEAGSVGDGGGGHLRALGRVLGDLAEIGYDAQWTTIRASDIGAPHHRERIFLLISADPDGLGLEAQQLPSRPAQEVTGDHDSQHPLPGVHDWGKYTLAIKRWESITRPAPTPIQRNSNGRWHLNPAFPEWMMGLPAGWITGVPGLSRADQLKAAGNGVVPQQAAHALRKLIKNTTERTNHAQ